MTACSESPGFSSSTEVSESGRLCDAVGPSAHHSPAALSSESVLHNSTHPVFQVAPIQKQLSEF